MHPSLCVRLRHLATTACAFVCCAGHMQGCQELHAGRCGVLCGCVCGCRRLCMNLHMLLDRGWAAVCCGYCRTNGGQPRPMARVHHGCSACTVRSTSCNTAGGRGVAMHPQRRHLSRRVPCEDEWSPMLLTSRARNSWPAAAAVASKQALPTSAPQRSPGASAHVCRATHARPTAPHCRRHSRAAKQQPLPTLVGFCA
jgi:hypothetical protein